MSRQYLHFHSVVQVHFYDLLWTLPQEYSFTHFDRIRLTFSVAAGTKSTNVRQLAPWTIRPRQLALELQTRHLADLICDHNGSVRSNMANRSKQNTIWLMYRVQKWHTLSSGFDNLHLRNFLTTYKITYRPNSNKLEPSNMSDKQRSTRQNALRNEIVTSSKWRRKGEPWNEKNTGQLSLACEIVTSFKMAPKRWTMERKTRVTFRLRAQGTYAITGNPED